MNLSAIFKSRRWKVMALLLMFLLTAIPFLVLSNYNHPSADDFCYTIDTNSLGFFGVQANYYLTWTGRYTATFLLALSKTNPENLMDHRVLPVLLLISFCISIYYFVGKLLPGTSILHKSSLVFVIFFLYMAAAPSVAEAFYWKPASLTYQLALILSLVFFGLILSLERMHSKKRKVLLAVLISLLSIFIIGLNETTMLMLCAILSLLLFLKSFRRKKIAPALGIIFLVSLIAAVIVIKAPGNLERMSEKPEKWDFDFSLTSSRTVAKWFVLHQWLPLFIPVIILFWESLKKAALEIRFRYGLEGLAFWHILLYTLFFYVLVVLTFFPSFWSQGGQPPNRTVNTIYFLTIVGALTFIILLVIFLKNKGLNRMHMSLPAKIFAAVALILTVAESTPHNIRNAYSDLFSGRAAKYDFEMQQRYTLLENCDKQECFVPPIRNLPLTIFAYDLAHKPSSEIYYYNECLEGFYGIKCLFKIEEVPVNEDS